ncbi:MAG: hypothetical protein AB8B73_12695 [Ekhidna sp.]
MNHYGQKRRKKFEGTHFIGSLLIVTGIVAGIASFIVDFNPPFNNMIPLAICMLCIGLMIFSTFMGVEINFEKNAFREYFSFCGIKFGQWNLLPEISKIKVKTDRAFVTNFSNGVSPTLSGKIKEHKVILYANQPLPIISFGYNSREESIKYAEMLATNLKTKVEVE